MAATNGVKSHSLVAQDLPPYAPGKAYTLKSLCGEIIYIPCSKSAMRLLVTGVETEGAFALAGTGGSQSPPIGFHFHREAHDIFLCLKGNINIWADDTCRTMGPGDLASVPPGTVHQYQILGEYTEFIGLIIPGGWEEFFRFIGEPYDGPMWPLVDNRNPFEVLIPKLKAATEKFDMIPQPKHPQCEPQPWDGTENKLPGKLAPYYLKADKGPKYLVDGAVVRPMVTTKESADKFSIGSIDGSSFHANVALATTMSFANVHHALQVADGQIEVTIDENKTVLATGETLYIPKGSQFSLRVASRYARAYVFANGGGLIELLSASGSSHEHGIAPEKEQPISFEEFRRNAEQFGCTLHT